MAPIDRAWWRMHGPTTPLVISGVLFFDDQLDIERVRATVMRRISAIDRFHDRVARGATRRPLWERDRAFDASAHVRESRLPSADDEAVWAKVGELLGEQLDPTRPPWCIDLVHPEGGGSLMLVRVHHAVGDGIALMLVLLALMDAGPEGGENPLLQLFRGDADGPAAARRYIDDVLPVARKLLLRGAGLRMFELPFAAIRSAVDGTRLALSRDEPKGLQRTRGPVRRVAWSRAVPLRDLAQLAHRLEVTLNDLLMSALCGALRRWKARHSRGPVQDIRVAVPINLRSLERMSELGNRFGLVFVPLPLAVADPIARLHVLRARTQRLKRSGQPLATYALLQACGVGPRAFTEFVFRLFERKVTAVVTNVPGPVRRLALCGSEITGLAFWVPTARTGIGISIVSYAGTVRVGVESDAALIDDPSVIVRAFEDELRALLELPAAMRG